MYLESVIIKVLSLIKFRCPGAGLVNEEGTVIRKKFSFSWRAKDASELVSELAGCRVLCSAVWQWDSSPLCKRGNRNEIINITESERKWNLIVLAFETFFMACSILVAKILTLSANDILKWESLGTTMRLSSGACVEKVTAVTNAGLLSNCSQ